MESAVNFTNFHDATKAIFTPCDKPGREPDFVSKSGSAYWDLGHGVVRCSDHWNGSIRSCSWFLAVQMPGMPSGCFDGEAFGYCAYGDFKERWERLAA